MSRAFVILGVGAVLLAGSGCANANATWPDASVIDGGTADGGTAERSPRGPWLHAECASTSLCPGGVPACAVTTDGEGRPTRVELDFCNVKPGTSARAAVTLSNIGDEPLVLGGFPADPLLGARRILLEMAAMDALTLAPGAEVPVAFSFYPAISGREESATLDLGVNAGPALTIHAHGTGARDWKVVYDQGFKIRPGTWLGTGTSSEYLEDEGLRIVDPSADQDSGRLYTFNWGAVPADGAEVEARMRTVSSSGGLGVTLFVSDGVHEESVRFTLNPGRVTLVNANRGADFDTAAFHTYRVAIQGTDIRVWADDALLIDGQGAFTHPAYQARNMFAFGSFSSADTGESVWQHVQFKGGTLESPVAAELSAPGLSVRALATRPIVADASTAGVFPGLFQRADGTLFVNSRFGSRRSSDGVVWTTATTTGAPTGDSCELPDGKVIWLGGRATALGLAAPGYFTTPRSLSTDGLESVTRSDLALIHVPDAVAGLDDQGNPLKGPVADHSMILLSDGSLLASMYGWFSGDQEQAPGMAEGVFKYRVFVIRSTDEGASWEYLSTVAYDPKVGDESFCEPDLLRLPSGDILALMRTGGGNYKPDEAPYTPLYATVSTDEGATWAPPVPIADRGVWPSVVRMSNGILVATYGRPGNWLAFSLDSGKTWPAHLQHNAGGNSTGYTGIAEIAPDVILVVWHETGIDADGNPTNGVVGTTFSVSRN